MSRKAGGAYYDDDDFDDYDEEDDEYDEYDDTVAGNSKVGAPRLCGQHARMGQAASAMNIYATGACCMRTASISTNITLCCCGHIVSSTCWFSAPPAVLSQITRPLSRPCCVALPVLQGAHGHKAQASKAAAKPAHHKPLAPAAAAGASAMAAVLSDPPPLRPDGRPQRGGRHETT